MRIERGGNTSLPQIGIIQKQDTIVGHLEVSRVLHSRCRIVLKSVTLSIKFSILLIAESIHTVLFTINFLTVVCKKKRSVP